MQRAWRAVFGFVLLVWLAQATATAPAADQRPGPLVSAAWLQQNLTGGGILLLDAQFAKAHAAGHIPGAVNVDLFTYGADEADAQAMQARLNAWGVSPGRRIVIYDQGGTFLATRLFYELAYRGFPVEQLHVLDGGLAKWREGGGAVTTEATPAPPAGTFRAALRAELRAELPEVLAAAADPARAALIDAQDAAMYFGVTRYFDRAGHLPQAVLWPTADFFNPDKTFKSAAQIQAMARHLGLGPQQVHYTYCGGGIAASVPYFALRHVAGYPQVKLFVGSQLAWLQDDRGLPLWTYAAPALVRETQWLAGWSHPMLRAYGVSRLNVIDVRPAEPFAQGHIPFARNVPAQALRDHLQQHEALARLLAVAGIQPAQDAVIVSERGVDPHSALAYLALRSLGHPRVSILTAGMDDWALQGHPISKQATPAATSAYAARAPVQVFTTESAAADSSAPRIYVASGAKSPATALPAGAVQLPYTSFLLEDGTPRAAKELWSVIGKAGIPRYAQLVFVADDPGEAAVNYYIFELMGYTNLRVLLP
jgi:3-mercaptopyruvate sulfurtransferase SseA